MVKFGYFNFNEFCLSIVIAIARSSLNFCKLFFHQLLKITFKISMFTEHSPSEILSLNFEKKTVYLNCNFPF